MDNSNLESQSRRNLIRATAAGAGAAALFGGFGLNPLIGARNGQGSRQIDRSR